MEITQRQHDLVGRLRNWPVFVYLHPDSIIRFHIDNSIDYSIKDEEWKAQGKAA